MSNVILTIEKAICEDPCSDGVERMRYYIRERKSGPLVDSVEFSIGDVANVYLLDAIWCLRFVQEKAPLVELLKSVSGVRKSTILVRSVTYTFEEFNMYARFKLIFRIYNTKSTNEIMVNKIQELFPPIL